VFSPVQARNIFYDRIRIDVNNNLHYVYYYLQRISKIKLYLYAGRDNYRVNCFRVRRVSNPGVLSRKGGLEAEI
jgi:hypothetical protein